MLPSLAPFFTFLPYKVWSFASLDNTWCSFFLPSRSSILNMVYLYYFRSQICDFRFYSIPLSLLSNAICLTQFGFFKRELCPISHYALIMDCFSRAHLYGVPRVIFLHSVLKFIEKKLQSLRYLPLFTKFQSHTHRESYNDFPKVTSLRWISRARKNTEFSQKLPQDLSLAP